MFINTPLTKGSLTKPVDRIQWNDWKWMKINQQIEMLNWSRASGLCTFKWNPSPGSRSGLISVVTGILPIDFSRLWIEKRAFQDLKATIILSTSPTYTQTAEFKDSFTKSSLNHLPCCPNLHRGERWPCQCWHWNSIDRLFLAAENMWKGLQMLPWSDILEHRTCFEEATSQGTQLKIKATKPTPQRETVDPNCLTAMQELLCSLAVC